MAICDFQKYKSLIPKGIIKIASDIKKKGGVAYIVGGWPRDMIMGCPNNDMDIEVFKIELEQLKYILRKYGKVKLVGKSFGVFQLNLEGKYYDFSLPRKEKKIGKKHRDFTIDIAPNISFKEASIRRDFTINSMGVNLSSFELCDPWGGKKDIEKKLLRNVSNSFMEDPLRVLRLVQFAARFNFNVAPETENLCRGISLAELSKERIFEEIKKLLLLAAKPSLGMELLLKLDLLKNFPELQALVGVKQDPQWHPEGDVWTHNNCVIDCMAEMRTDDLRDNLVLILAALCHDLGKAKTTVYKDNKWRSPGHEKTGGELSETFLLRLTEEKKLIKEVSSLVREHLKPSQLYIERDRLTSAAIKRLSLRVDIQRLIKLAEADWKGKDCGKNKNKIFKPGKWLLEECDRLGIFKEKITPFVTGKLLLSLGLKPGPKMGALVKECFEKQLDGEIKNLEEAKAYLSKKLK